MIRPNRAIGMPLLLFVALTILNSVIVGCEYFPESSFELGKESRLPKCFRLQPGLTRSDVSVTLNLYSTFPGRPDASFVLKDRKGRTLEEVKGKSKQQTPSTYSIVTTNGITETIRLRPYREHENMEQNGTAVALFYVIDDPALAK